MENISKNVTYAEAVKSQTAERLGIQNIPDAAKLKNMQRIAAAIFEPVRRDVAGNKPLSVTSFFRSEDTNAAAGGTPLSQHCKGEAMDIDADVFGNGTNAQIFDYIQNNLEFDQLIWEFGDTRNPAWVHVSLKAKNNRKQTLRSLKRKGRTIYEPFKR